jgi:membrane protein implicated in regulation of membrane protease activity
MQIYIARVLNALLLLFSAVIVILFAGIFIASRFFPGYLRWHILLFAVTAVVLTLFYRYLEENWDKRIILKMAREGKIGLMRINGGKRLMAMRDTAFRHYWIYELEGELYNAEHERLAKTFQEKMNSATEEIPSGFVYVTYDEQKPAQIFIIPNAMIGGLPGLMPIVKGYEKNSAIPVRYLDAHYNRGMVLKTYREAMADYKKAQT